MPAHYVDMNKKEIEYDGGFDIGNFLWGVGEVIGGAFTVKGGFAVAAGLTGGSGGLLAGVGIAGGAVMVGVGVGVITDSVRRITDSF